MRKITEYHLEEWSRLDPLKYAFKEFRNRVVQAIYNRIGANGVNNTLEACKRNQNNILVMVILFETPWVADWLCRSVQNNLINANVVLFDNSRTADARAKNKNICEAHKMLYVALPRLPIWNVNWSHSAAMQWIYSNFIRILRPAKFAFIDHDMIPFNRIDLSDRVDGQPFYGLLRPGGKNEKCPGAWSLWAGYCVFNYKEIKYQKLDFLYNFSMGLDTGGGNFELLYNKYNKASMSFSPVFSQTIDVPGFGLMDELQIIDGKWIHLGSVSYAGKARSKQDYWRALDSALASGVNFESMLVSSQRTW